MAGRTTTLYLASACAMSGRWKALANGAHTGGSVRGPSGNRLHGGRGAVGVARLATSNQWRFGGGGYPLLANC
jgi:hypothetical protein